MEEAMFKTDDVRRNECCFIL